MLLTLNIKKFFSLSASFTVLGLKSTSKMEDVKRKYYELAKMYHPDVNSTDKNAHNKFTEITKAYKHIVDNYDAAQGFYQTTAQKTTKKDQTSSTETNFKNQKRHKTGVEQEDYEDFYQYDIFFKKSKKFRKPKVGEDIYINLTITLQESILGAHKTISYTKYEPCSSCASKQFSACFSCGGKGQIYDRINREKVRCENCSGKGFKNQCLDCLGASYVLKEVTDKIYVEKGTKDKTILRMEKKGHSGFKAGNGDLYVTVFVEESDRFRIDGNNVHLDYQLDYVTATMGGTIQVQTVYGLKQFVIPPGTQSGSELRMFNLGLKSPYSKRLGDQIIKIKIKIPQKLNPKQKQLLQKLCQSEK